MANTPSDKPAAGQRIKMEQVGKDKVLIEFRIEELVTQLINRASAESCMGCMGCMASRSIQEV